MTQIEGFAVKHSNEAGTWRVVDMVPKGKAEKWGGNSCLKKKKKSASCVYVYAELHQKLNKSDTDRLCNSNSMC